MANLRLASVAAAIALCGFTTGCAESADTVDRTSAAAPTTVGSSTAAAGPAEPEAVVIDIKIADGNVSPLNARTDAVVGQPIVLRVDSDVADELHVHSNPDQEFTVEPVTGQEFRFTVTVPGQVAVELHEADRTVTTLLVRQ